MFTLTSNFKLIWTRSYSGEVLSIKNFTSIDGNEKLFITDSIGGIDLMSPTAKTHYWEKSDEVPHGYDKSSGTIKSFNSWKSKWNAEYIYISDHEFIVLGNKTEVYLVNAISGKKLFSLRLERPCKFLKYFDKTQSLIIGYNSNLVSILPVKSSSISKDEMRDITLNFLPTNAELLDYKSRSLIMPSSCGKLFIVEDLFNQKTNKAKSTEIKKFSMPFAITNFLILKDSTEANRNTVNLFLSSNNVIFYLSIDSKTSEICKMSEYRTSSRINDIDYIILKDISDGKFLSVYLILANQSKTIEFLKIGRIKNSLNPEEPVEFEKEMFVVESNRLLLYLSSNVKCLCASKKNISCSKANLYVGIENNKIAKYTFEEVEFAKASINDFDQSFLKNCNPTGCNEKLDALHLFLEKNGFSDNSKRKIIEYLFWPGATNHNSAGGNIKPCISEYYSEIANPLIFNKLLILFYLITVGAEIELLSFFLKQVNLSIRNFENLANNSPQKNVFKLKREMISHLNNFSSNGFNANKRERLTRASYCEKDAFKKCLIDGILLKKGHSIVKRFFSFGDNWRIKKVFNTTDSKYYIFFSSYFNKSFYFLSPYKYKLYAINFKNSATESEKITTFFSNDDKILIIYGRTNLVSFELKELSNLIQKESLSQDPYTEHFDSKADNDQNIYEKKANQLIISKYHSGKIFGEDGKENSKQIYSSCNVDNVNHQIGILGGRTGQIYSLKPNGNNYTIQKIALFNTNSKYNPVWLIKRTEQDLFFGTENGEVATFTLQDLSSIKTKLSERGAHSIVPLFKSKNDSKITDLYISKFKKRKMLLVGDLEGFLYAIEKKKVNSKDLWPLSWEFRNYAPVSKISTLVFKYNKRTEHYIAVNYLFKRINLFRWDGLHISSIKLDSPLYSFAQIGNTYNFKPAESDKVVTLIGPTIDGSIVATDVAHQKFVKILHSRNILLLFRNGIEKAVSQLITNPAMKQRLAFLLKKHFYGLTQKSYKDLDPSIKTILDAPLKTIIKESLIDENILTDIVPNISKNDLEVIRKAYGKESDESNGSFSKLFILSYYAIKTKISKLISTNEGKLYVNETYQKLVHDLDTKYGFKYSLSSVEKTINKKEFLGYNSAKIRITTKYLIKNMHYILVHHQIREVETYIDEFLKILIKLVNNWGEYGSKTNVLIKLSIVKSMFRYFTLKDFEILFKAQNISTPNFYNILMLFFQEGSLLVQYKAMQYLYRLLEKIPPKKNVKQYESFVINRFVNIVHDTIILNDLYYVERRWLFNEALRILLLFRKRLKNYINYNFYRFYNKIIVYELPSLFYLLISNRLKMNKLKDESEIFNWTYKLLNEYPNVIEKHNIKNIDLEKIKNVKAIYDAVEIYKEIKLNDIDRIEFADLLNLNSQPNSSDYKKADNRVSLCQYLLHLDFFDNQINKLNLSCGKIAKKILFKKDKTISGKLFTIRLLIGYLTKKIDRVYNHKNKCILDYVILGALQKGAEKLKKLIEEKLPYFLQETIGLERILHLNQFYIACSNAQTAIHFAVEAHSSKTIIFDPRKNNYQINEIDRFNNRMETHKLDAPSIEQIRNVIYKFFKEIYNTKTHNAIETLIINFANSIWDIDEQNHPMEGIQIIYEREYFIYIMALNNIPYGVFIFNFKHTKDLQTTKPIIPYLDLPKLSLSNYLLNKQLEKVKAQFETLSANFGHNMRQPLSALEQLCEAIELSWDRIDDKNKYEMFCNMKVSAHDLDKRLRKLIRSFSIHRGRGVDVKSNSIELISFVSDICSYVRRANKGQGVELSPVQYENIISENNLGYFILADKYHLQDILYNLLENAIKYSPRKRKVVLKVIEKKQRILFEVWDEGNGISDEDKEIIFEPFIRLEKEGQKLKRNSNKENDGFGIGLYVSKFLVENAFKSNLEVINNPSGKGSIFSFHIRRRIIEEENTNN